MNLKIYTLATCPYDPKRGFNDSIITDYMAVHKQRNPLVLDITPLEFVGKSIVVHNYTLSAEAIEAIKRTYIYTE
jgi:hypothetical protein